MPTYEFKCPACDERFEVDRPMGQTAGVCCPACGTPAKRVFSPSAVVFKGSGFHNTDYKKRPTEAMTGSSAPSGEKAKDASAKPASGATDLAKKPKEISGPSSSE